MDLFKSGDRRVHDDCCIYQFHKKDIFDFLFTARTNISSQAALKALKRIICSPFRKKIISFKNKSSTPLPLATLSLKEAEQKKMVEVPLKVIKTKQSGQD